MASRSQRAMALTLALLFLATTVGTGAAVVFQMRQEKQNEEAARALQESLKNQTGSTIDQPNEQEQGMLQGTKLEGFTPVASTETLQITDLVVGTGDEVKAGATVTAHYTGAVAADGTIFQSSHDRGQPIPFSLNGVIKGWTDGVPGMKVGGKRRLLIPAALAYGANPPAGSGIPANADLVFDIEITAVEQ